MARRRTFKDLIAKAEVLQPKFGPTPKVRVYYLNLPKRFIAGTVYDPATEEVVIGATVTLSGDGHALPPPPMSLATSGLRA